ncbi:GNAT family N-acetyltransferase [Pseudoalteromonas luteoviolacea]|uniref:GNAT family N-acetyltransferase n=1 Tax=Pseudoalteromonas luteoviolacea TaxID=43657 RepID=UPI001B39E68A|nr:GNAT family N-acetyltransferase [Pseudoalteromonas luteoviolacea]MBQ4880296.1 GNAT family N-acetyltransferase [Pseudoalteromonas luteoviolacea]MBQ4909357.1 GNAT family N-acetyltransferase [Pseudoalteromonas luteoviolacea]
MNIRAYTQNDLASIFDIYRRSKLDELKFEEKVFTLLPLEEDKERLRGLMESQIYVYQEQGQILGFGANCGHEIRALFVAPKHRGKGVGKALFEFLLSNIHGQPCLYVASTNQPAKYLYHEYGFSVTETFETTYNQVSVIAQKMVRMASV